MISICQVQAKQIYYTKRSLAISIQNLAFLVHVWCCCQHISRPTVNPQAYFTPYSLFVIYSLPKLQIFSQYVHSYQILNLKEKNLAIPIAEEEKKDANNNILFTPFYLQFHALTQITF